MLEFHFWGNGRTKRCRVASRLTPSHPPASSGYPPVYFRPPRNPISALDMLAYLPGFTFDAVAAPAALGRRENVLVDGARPASKDDGLEDVASSNSSHVGVAHRRHLRWRPRHRHAGQDRAGPIVIPSPRTSRQADDQRPPRPRLDSQASGNLLLEGGEGRVGRHELWKVSLKRPGNTWTSSGRSRNLVRAGEAGTPSFLGS